MSSRYSSGATSNCASRFFFHKQGEPVTEASLQPDMELVNYMIEGRIRVQDILDAILDSKRGCAPNMTIIKLVNWWQRRQNENQAK